MEDPCKEFWDEWKLLRGLKRVEKVRELIHITKLLGKDEFEAAHLIDAWMDDKR